MSKKTKNTFEDIVLHSALYEKKVLSDIDIESIDEYIKTENYEVFCSRKTSMAYAALHGREIDIETELKLDFINFFQFPIETTIDCHCEQCGKNKGFLFDKSSARKIQDDFEKPVFINLGFECITCKKEKIYFTFKIDNNVIEKTGEYPSKYSLAKNETAPYKKILGEHLDEYNKAIIVNSLGFSIAGFTYLRRIFEKFIFEMFDEHKDELGIEFEEFKKQHKEDQFKLLKPHLPDWINTNKKTLYGILSVHIHELTEESAVKFFPLIKRAIDIVVKYRFETLQASKEEKEVENELHQAHSILKK